MNMYWHCATLNRHIQITSDVLDLISRNGSVCFRMDSVAKRLTGWASL